MRPHSKIAIAAFLIALVPAVEAYAQRGRGGGVAERVAVVAGHEWVVVAAAAARRWEE